MKQEIQRCGLGGVMHWVGGETGEKPEYPRTKRSVWYHALGRRRPPAMPDIGPATSSQHLAAAARLDRVMSLDVVDDGVYFGRRIGGIWIARHVGTRPVPSGTLFARNGRDENGATVSAPLPCRVNSPEASRASGRLGLHDILIIDDHLGGS
jgi:hypothetical protein